MDMETIEDFLSFLRGTVSIQQKKPLSYRYQKKILDGLKSIVSWCRVYEPESVPANEIFMGNEFIGTNERLKIDYIPDDVVEQINRALKNEKNPYLRYGIIIMECTGMRKGDLLDLKRDCISRHPVNGFLMQWRDHKTGRERDPVPVPAECVEAVKCYSCSRYITTPEYLDAHREHLAALERQVKEGRTYGEHYISHFLPVMEVLRVIIKELEAMEDGKKELGMGNAVGNAGRGLPGKRRHMGDVTADAVKSSERRA